MDIFLTSGDEVLNDSFLAPVMSVDVWRNIETSDEGGEGAVLAFVTEQGSDWLALAFPINAGVDEKARWSDVRVGDQIRVGTAAGGFTDYLTVLEAVSADVLINSTSMDWEIKSFDPKDIVSYDPDFLAGIPAYASDDIAGAPYGSGRTALKARTQGSYITNDQRLYNSGWTNPRYPNATDPGYPIRCLRVNHAIDASTLPSKFCLYTNALATSAERGRLYTYYPKEGTRPYDGADRREMFYYPCYMQRRVNPATSLHMQLPSDLGKVSGITLLGYSLRHQPDAGMWQGHERTQDDWYALSVQQVGPHPTKLSNNEHAHGRLYVVHSGHGGDMYEYEPQGLAHTSFSPRNFPALTVTVHDRKGNRVNFAHMHVWLRLH